MKRNIPVMKFNSVATALFIGCLALGLGGSMLVKSPVAIIVGALIGLYLLCSIKVADQWEKVAVLRLGRYRGLRGPRLFTIVPIVDTLSWYVDQRVRVADVTAESTLTRDTVPVNVDAVVFWMVWNAEKSILEVEDFVQAIMVSAQTALRESIGRHELAEMITKRESMGRELQRILDEKTTSWESPFSPSRFAMCAFRRRWKTPCPARRRPSANGRPATSWDRPKQKLRRALPKLLRPITTIQSRCTCGR